ncbi:Rpn family recombination-promoting nuclease/putative transposase [Clostridium sp. C8-1-8]|uniref:Rpn family recombination-promoting nuclease/putative transposase n=1 Tax=Clostridium sp. C8-1-8 TaxID=2698831 RepID=UPI001FAE222A|nr:Rpn family recombination-promoting nuclease/putative transposase [Clostridium sp. C8-1-8]
MSPKIDFVFKLIFGDEKNKDILIAFLSATLRLNKEDFQGIEFLNTELLKEFKEDKKGILDVRVKTKNNEHIDIEIQIFPTEFMAERSLFYWSKMYNSQVSPGDTYDKLKKCITINIVDFERIPLDKIHTTFHILEDETGYKLSDVLEIHFLELPKLSKLDSIKDLDAPILDWLEFIDSDSKEEMEMIAEKNENIKTAYEILQRVSKSKEARMAYEARQAEIMDQLTREKAAREEGFEQGTNQKAIEIAKNLLGLIDDETIAIKTGLPLELVKNLKN